MAAGGRRGELPTDVRVMLGSGLVGVPRPVTHHHQTPTHNLQMLLDGARFAESAYGRQLEYVPMHLSLCGAQ